MPATPPDEARWSGPERGWSSPKLSLWLPLQGGLHTVSLSAKAQHGPGIGGGLRGPRDTKVAKSGHSWAYAHGRSLPDSALSLCGHGTQACGVPWAGSGFREQMEGPPAGAVGEERHHDRCTRLSRSSGRGQLTLWGAGDLEVCWTSEQRGEPG